MFEREVDTSREERGGEDKADDLHLESTAVERVPIHHDPPSVSDRLHRAADDGSDHPGPCLVSDPEYELGDREDCKARTEKGICAEIRVVSVDCGLDGA